MPDLPHTADAVVIGAGLVGCATAAALSAAGMDVCIVDRAGLLAGTSASGEGNLLVSDKQPGVEVDFMLRSLALWQEFAETAADIEFDEKGGVVVAWDEEQVAALEAFAAEQRPQGVVAERCEPREVEPQLNPDVVGALRYPQDCQVQPMAAAAAYLSAARRTGAVFVDDACVVGASIKSGELLGVRTNRGEIATPCAVVAAGPWSADAASALGVRASVSPRRGHIIVTEPVVDLVRHKVYEADYVSTITGDAEDVSFSAVVESTASGPVLIGSSREFVGFDRQLDRRVLAGLVRRATRLFPVLSSVRAMRAYCGFRPATADRLPMIGPVREVSGVYLATGHEGAGIGLAPATAELVTALITGADPVVDPAVFDPGRLT